MGLIVVQKYRYFDEKKSETANKTPSELNTIWIKDFYLSIQLYDYNSKLLMDLEFLFIKVVFCMFRMKNLET